jgi:O-antigen ligase
MQTAQPTLSTWQRTSAARLPSGGLFAYVRGLSLSAYLFSLLFGFWFTSDWGTSQELRGEGFDIKRYFFFGFGVALLAHLTLGVQTWIEGPFQMLSTWVGRLLTAFCALMLLLSPISRVGFTSGLFAVATWGTALMLWLFWESNYRVLQRCLVFACWLQFAWWLVLLKKHGQPFGFGYGIGDINRNVTGTAVLAAMICGLFAVNRYLRWAAVAAAVVFIVLVTSRGSMVALATFAIVYYALNFGVPKLVAHGSIAGVAALLVILIVPRLHYLVFEKVFQVHDAGRGIGSGFTGRTEMWQQGLAAFWKNPVLGYGFRCTSYAGSGDYGGVHSAFIKVFVEAGMIGGFLIIGAMVVETIRRLRISLQLRKLQPGDMPGINLAESFRINSIACATMFLTFTIWVYDQYYINLGSPISVIFFLMLMAPTYVTDQDALIRR